MSIESFAIALNHSRAKGTAKLVLVGIANHDGDGGAWPSIATLARYANTTERSVQRAIDTLEGLGEVRRIHGQGGDHSTPDGRRPNLYRILLTCPPDCDRTSNHRTRRTSVSTPLPIEVTPASPLTPASPDDVHVTGGGDASVTQTIPLTTRTKDTTQPQYARARNEERSARSLRPASAIAGSCMNGHPYVAESGSGVPFCALGCAPDVVGESSPTERESA